MAVADNKKQMSVLRSIWCTSNVVLNRYLGRSPRYLPALLLFVTDRCNLQCRSCGVCDLAALPAQKKHLSTEQWKDVITSAAANLGTSQLSITGGEPLLRTDIYEIIRFAADAGMSVHISTNGVLLDRERVGFLRDSGVSAVSIPLESPEKETHDYLRGENTFSAVLDSIKLLRYVAPNIRIGINCLITRHNYQHMTEMVAFAESLDVHLLRFIPIHTNLLQRHKDSSSYADLLFREEDLECLQQEVKRVGDACAASPLLTPSDTFFSGVVSLYKTPKKFRCYAGYAVCAITATGDVSPCSGMDSEFNILEKALDVIWRDSSFHKLRKKVHRCDIPCWDTMNTELSARLRPGALVREFCSYFAKRHE